MFLLDGYAMLSRPGTESADHRGLKIAAEKLVDYANMLSVIANINGGLGQKATKKEGRRATDGEDAWRGFYFPPGDLGGKSWLSEQTTVAGDDDATAEAEGILLRVRQGERLRRDKGACGMWRVASLERTGLKKDAEGGLSALT